MTVTPIAPRKIRCRVSDRRRNPCPNEALDEFGICWKHLSQIADHWQFVTATAAAMLYGDETGETS